MNRFLERIVAVKRDEVSQRRRVRPLETLLTSATPERRPFGAALREPGPRAIAEFKRRSPSKGLLRRDADPDAVARTFEEHGAAALSVLTDELFFGGSSDDLLHARRACALPVLRKDFVLDGYQLHEARVLGADAVLLIVRLLSRDQLDDLVGMAREIGLESLVEAHDAEEVARAVASGADIVGVNSRDLDTFDTDLDAALELRCHIPGSRLAVAESGIRDRADVERVAAAGFDAFLVGEALMRAPDPGRALDELLGLGPLAGGRHR